MPLSDTRSANSTEGGRGNVTGRTDLRGQVLGKHEHYGQEALIPALCFPNQLPSCLWPRRTRASEGLGEEPESHPSARAETWTRMCSVHITVLAEGRTHQVSTKARLWERGSKFIQKASLTWAFFFFKEHGSIFSSTWKLSTGKSSGYWCANRLTTALFWFCQNWGIMWERLY